MSKREKLKSKIAEREIEEKREQKELAQETVRQFLTKERNFKKALFTLDEKEIQWINDKVKEFNLRSNIQINKSILVRAGINALKKMDQKQLARVLKDMF